MNYLQNNTSILGVKISPLSYKKTLACITDYIDSHKKGYICVSAVHLVMECQNNEYLKEGVNEATLITPDGLPLVWILQRRKLATDRIYGPDLMLAICQTAEREKWRIFLLGGSTGQSHVLQRKLRNLFPQLRIVGNLDTPNRIFLKNEGEKAISLINASNAHVVFVGLGCPTQELWMIQNRNKLNSNMLIGVGAAFDYISEFKKHAPRWIRENGFEWLFRLVQEPRRLWRRYLILNVKFIFEIIRTHSYKKIPTT